MQAARRIAPRISAISPRSWSEPIGADDPIELIYGADGSPLDDDEFGELFLRLPVAASTQAESRPDVRPQSV